MTVPDDDSPEASRPAASLFDRRDRQKARSYASFVWGSVRRHRALFTTVFILIVGSTVGSFFVCPTTFHVETKALAQPTSALSVRGDGPSADSLTRAAADTVLRQENLLALIKETDLLQYTRDHRAPAQRVRDAIVHALPGRKDTEADQLDALEKTLESKLVVWTSDSGNNAGGSTVTIAIDWPDAAMACRLVDGAQRAFLDARYAREVTALSESIEILRKHAAGLKADVDDAVGTIEKMRGMGNASPKTTADTADTAAATPRPRPLVMRRAAAPRPDLDVKQPPNPEVEAKQHAIDELEDLRRRRLSELQARLAEARATYTENHPVILDLKQSIAALSVESAQVSNLRQELASLRAEREASTAEASAATPAVTWVPAPANGPVNAAAVPPQLPSDVLRIALDLKEDRDPMMVYARGQLRDAMDKYAALRTQIQTAQIDLETAQAAFKYRYTVVTPARLPRRPSVPNIPVVTLVSLVVAILCGLLLVVLVDLRRGRLLERWQLESLLNRPILGEVALPDDLESA